MRAFLRKMQELAVITPLHCHCPHCSRFARKQYAVKTSRDVILVLAMLALKRIHPLDRNHPSYSKNKLHIPATAGICNL